MSDGQTVKRDHVLRDKDVVEFGRCKGYEDESAIRQIERLPAVVGSESLEKTRGGRSRTCGEGRIVNERDDYADNDLPPPRRVPEGCVYILIGFVLFGVGVSVILVMWFLSLPRFD